MFIFYAGLAHLVSKGRVDIGEAHSHTEIDCTTVLFITCPMGIPCTLIWETARIVCNLPNNIR